MVYFNIYIKIMTNGGPVEFVEPLEPPVATPLHKGYIRISLQLGGGAKISGIQPGKT